MRKYGMQSNFLCIIIIIYYYYQIYLKDTLASHNNMLVYRRGVCKENN